MYNHDTHEHDLAIYFLNRTISSVEPVELPVPVGEQTENTTNDLIENLEFVIPKYCSLITFSRITR